jgi:hypothetical protein
VFAWSSDNWSGEIIKIQGGLVVSVRRPQRGGVVGSTCTTGRLLPLGEGDRLAWLPKSGGLPDQRPHRSKEV